MARQKMEKLKNQEEQFEDLYQKILLGQFEEIEYDLEFPKHEFFKFLKDKDTVLFHGTNVPNIKELEPRQANCTSKKFGNLNAVYSTQDPILPFFHAVFNNKNFRGFSSSGVETNDENTKYIFKINGTFPEQTPWTTGYIYILDKTQFEQGTDDDGKLIDEFISRTPIQPLAKIKINPEDFPYLNEVEIIK